MRKLEFKSVEIVYQSEIKQSEKGNKYMYIHVKEPELKRGDEVVADAVTWEMFVGDKRVAELPEGTNLVGVKCDIKAYLNSSKWEKDAKSGFNTSISVQDIQLKN